jgi:hypothetical protein
MGQQDDGLFGVTHDLVRKTRLIVEDERDAIGRGDVPGCDDRELVPGQIARELDGPDAPARHRASDRDPVQHGRQAQVVDVPCGSRDLGASFLPRDRYADESNGHLSRILPLTDVQAGAQ